MDITNFMTWFVEQVVSIFSKMFSILDSITFAGTSLLSVIITIIILGVLIPVILTISQNVSVVGQRSEKVKEKRERQKHNEE